MPQQFYSQLPVCPLQILYQTAKILRLLIRMIFFFFFRCIQLNTIEEFALHVSNYFLTTHKQVITCLISFCAVNGQVLMIINNYFIVAFLGKYSAVLSCQYKSDLFLQRMHLYVCNKMKLFISVDSR